MKTGRSLRTCLSRGVPADHEAQNQVKEEEAAAGVKALKGSPSPNRKTAAKREAISQNSESWGRPRARKRDKSTRETRGHTANSSPDEPMDHAVAHVCQHMNLRFVLRSGIGESRNSEAVDDIVQETETETLPSATEAKDRETQGPRTTPW